MTVPLHIDENIERQAQAKFSERIARWIKSVFPFIAHESSRSRASVFSQLERRSSGVRSRWDELSNPKLASEVCGLLRRELGLPNDRLIPEDPLDIILESAFQLDRRMFFHAVFERFGVRMSDEEWSAMCTEHWTIEDFVSEIEKRQCLRAD
ncbi:MAG: hypothetical protein A2Z18_10385 [Armatimonadetes bacterium RBG_16_58_9]|nr:MAG: hypothetical protein A2Z18_10385 [Armatimonadetes bacterium RBG_16_58_9]